MSLTTEGKKALFNKLNFDRFAANYNGTDLSPLAGPPQIEADIETKEVVTYAGGDEPIAEIVTKSNVKITIETTKVNAAMGLLDAAKGENLLDKEKLRPLAIAPIVDEGSGGEGGMSFTCYVSGYSTNFTDSDDKPNSVRITFTGTLDTTTDSGNDPASSTP